MELDPSCLKLTSAPPGPLELPNNFLSSVELHQSSSTSARVASGRTLWQGSAQHQFTTRDGRFLLPA
eukprot:9566793-Alexandrium_andersonii.AAC.1